MTTSSPPARVRTPADPRITALRGLALLSVLNVVWQGVSAGELLMRSRTGRELHEGGAIVLHVIMGLTVIAAALVWRAGRSEGASRTLWPLIVSAVVFVASFVQAALGHGRTLYLHVPLAMLLLLGSSLILAWSWRPTRSRAGGADRDAGSRSTDGGPTGRIG